MRRHARWYPGERLVGAAVAEGQPLTDQESLHVYAAASVAIFWNTTVLAAGVVNVIFDQTKDAFGDEEAWQAGIISQICIASVGLLGSLVARCCVSQHVGFATPRELAPVPHPMSRTRLACPCRLRSSTARSVSCACVWFMCWLAS